MARIDSVKAHFVPQEREDDIYDKWMEKGAFVAEADSDKPAYTIVMPPPNITGALHIGHALDLTLQDILVRQKRMTGFETLYLPGTDHASIATEVKIVETLREKGIEKEDLGREGFLERAWEWKEEYGGNIIEQAKKLGLSSDWTRLRFTLDEGLSKAVQQVFVNLYNKGLIYRGERLVNWCPDCQTSISDIEVDYEEKAGHFWHIRYPLADAGGYLEIATTRPETMLGDTALAVHPEDERYRQFIGKKAILPILNREIPIVADSYVEKDFGTGVVKVTPGHDPNDFEIGLRHDLPILSVMDEQGRINENGGKFAGLDRSEARRLIVQELEENGYLSKVEDIVHQVGHCSRCHTSVEPMVSMQWFVKMDELAKPAIDVVKDGQIKFVPERFSKIYFNWMENVRDWCISRQLWWGHRIPAWYCLDCGEITVSLDEPDTCAHCGKGSLRQDEDTLDTWFSSALWPFSTLGWPEATADMEKFFPTDVLVTGYDIIFFWVARMIFSSLEQTGKIPFKYVYIHGLVRDAEGRKMSKSLGNGIDPLDMIRQYGADALRFALINGISPGNDTRFSQEKIEAARNFSNKIWNAFRFALMNFDTEMDFSAIGPDDFGREDKWILHELQKLIQTVNQNFENFDLGIALGNIYSFLWDDFCDWYIEMVKARLQIKGKNRTTAQFVLNYVLVTAVKLLHPYMPFITEEIFKHLIHEEDDLVSSRWPEVREDFYFAESASEVAVLMEVIRTVRNLRVELNVPLKKEIELSLLCDDENIRELFSSSPDLLSHLAKIHSVKLYESDFEIPLQAVSANFSKGVLFIPLEDLIDIEEEIGRLEEERDSLEKEVVRCEKMLSNEQFVQRAPEKVVQKEREKLANYQEALLNTKERLRQLQQA